MTTHTFDGFGPFESGLQADERNRRLDRLASAAGGTEAAAYIEMIRLTKDHPRNLIPIVETLNKLPSAVQDAVMSAYKSHL